MRWPRCTGLPNRLSGSMCTERARLFAPPSSVALMTDLFDTASLRDEPEHWRALAERVAASAARESKRGGFDWMARSRVGWVAACLLLAVALMSLVSRSDRFSPQSRNESRAVEWSEVL